MLIRIVATVSLLALLTMVLYLPSAYPPERFIQQLHIEHRLNAQFWGDDYAMRTLSRMLDLYAQTEPASPAPGAPDQAYALRPVDAAVGMHVEQMTTRLLRSQYVRSFDSLLALAMYRVAVLVEWLPTLLVFVFAAVFDGAVSRIVRSKEFVQHSPEMYAIHASMAIVVACGTIIAFVLPVTLHPVVLAVVPVCIGVFSSQAVAHFHRRG